jgi:hypothetical protein
MNYVKIAHFMDHSGSEKAYPNTIVTLCHDEEYLHVNYTAENSMAYSPFSSCNDPLYEDDAVEMFLQDPLNSNFSHNYFEFEFSPKNVLFAARIFNDNLDCSAFCGEPI